MVYIYGLLCPLTEDIRYIGKSVSPAKRLSAHISGARTHAYSHHTSRWLRKLSRARLAPKLVILEELQDGADWREAERGWIASAIEAGWPLTNSTAGGEGLDYLSPNDHARWRANHQAAMARHWATASGKNHIKKLQEASKAPAVMAKRAESVRKACSGDAYRKLMVAVGTEIASRSEVKEAKSRKSAAMWRDRSTRARLMASFAGKRCKAKQSESKVAAWADPILGAKLRAIHSSDEVKRKKSEAKARNWADPAYRAMMSERIRAGHAKRRLNKGA